MINLRQALPKLLQPQIRSLALVPLRERKSYCRDEVPPYYMRPCFKLEDLCLEKAQPHHKEVITYFLNTYYWPSDPSVAGLWLPLDSQYLETLTFKHATHGNRILAFECPPPDEDPEAQARLIGMTAANLMCDWQIKEMEQWARNSCCEPSRNHLLFWAHVIKSANLFEKYNATTIYHIEVLGVASDKKGRGVGRLLLEKALKDACNQRHQVTAVVATGVYCDKLCRKLGMKKAWSTKYSDYVDHKNRRVFMPRRPHYDVTVYVQTSHQCDNPCPVFYTK